MKNWKNRANETKDLIKVINNMKEQRINEVANSPTLQVTLTNGMSRLKRGPKGALAKRALIKRPTC